MIPKFIAFIVRIRDFIFPIIVALRADRKINKQIDDIEKGRAPLQYMAHYDELAPEQIESFYNQSREQMKSLEEKSKISVFAITVAVTLTLGLCSVLIGISNEVTNSPILKISIIGVNFLTILYMIFAGWLSLQVLGNKNTVYQLFPEDYLLSEKDRLKLIAMNTELNVKQNAIRNNYVYTSYKNITYSIVTLGILFTLIVVSVTFPKPKDDSEWQNQSVRSLLKIEHARLDEIELLKHEHNGFSQHFDSLLAIQKLQLHQIKRLANSLEDSTKK